MSDIHIPPKAVEAAARGGGDMMSEDDIPTGSCCYTCRYSSAPFTHNYPDQSVSSVALLRCHRRSPVVAGGHMSPAWTAWPLVRRTEWCGEFDGELL